MSVLPEENVNGMKLSKSSSILNKTMCSYITLNTHALWIQKDYRGKVHIEGDHGRQMDVIKSE